MAVLDGSEPELVVLLTVDCLRADAAEGMATLSELSAAGVSVTDHHCTGSGTPTSMPGVMQSRLPTDHGGEPRSHPLVEGVPTLAEALSAAGVTCGGWHSNVYTSRPFGYERGFDTFADLKSDPPDRPVDGEGDGSDSGDRGRGDGEDESGEGGGERTLLDVGRAVAERFGVETLATRVLYGLRKLGVATGRPHVPADEVVDAMLGWLPEDGDEPGPRFAWGHVMDLHSPYLPPAEYRRAEPAAPDSARETWRLNERLRVDPGAFTDEEVDRLRGLYDASTAFVDDQLERLVDALRRRGRWEETLLVVTADHGELFGDATVPDDLAFGHANYLCAEITHVPLVLAGGAAPSATVEGVSSGTDVAPTVARALGADVPSEWDGLAVGGEAFEAREHVHSVTGRGSRQDNEPGEVPGDTLHASLRTAEAAVLWWSSHLDPEAYVRQSGDERRVDPADLPGFEDHVETIRERFADAADRFDDEVNTGAEGLDEATTERLRQLGYVE